MVIYTGKRALEPGRVKVEYVSIGERLVMEVVKLVHPQGQRYGMQSQKPGHKNTKTALFTCLKAKADTSGQNKQDNLML